MKNQSLAYETKIKYVRRRPAVETKVSGPDDVVSILRPYFDDCMDHHEEMYAAYFDHANNLICVTNVGRGALSATVADIRTLLQTAILSNASSVVIAHNHPSGNLKPSNQDIALTRKVKDALELFDMKLLDSLIITHNGYDSII